MRSNPQKAKIRAVYNSNPKTKEIDLVTFFDNRINKDITNNERVQSSAKHFGNLDDLRESLGWYWNARVEIKFGMTGKNGSELYVYLHDF